MPPEVDRRVLQAWDIRAHLGHGQLLHVAYLVLRQHLPFAGSQDEPLLAAGQPDKQILRAIGVEMADSDGILVIAVGQFPEQPAILVEHGIAGHHLVAAIAIYVIGVREVSRDALVAPQFVQVGVQCPHVGVAILEDDVPWPRPAVQVADKDRIAQDALVRPATRRDGEPCTGRWRRADDLARSSIGDRNPQVLTKDHLRAAIAI